MVGCPSVEHTPDGRRLVVGRTVDADPALVWDLLRDTARWPDWGPSVSAVRSDERYISAGSTGAVQIAGGPWVPYEIRTCDERRWTWRVARVPATGHRVSETPEGTRVAFEIPLLASPYAVVCRRALSQIAAIAESESRPDRGANTRK